jgi:hypothetical protein
MCWSLECLSELGRAPNSQKLASLRYREPTESVASGISLTTMVLVLSTNCRCFCSRTLISVCARLRHLAWWYCLRRSRSQGEGAHQGEAGTDSEDRHSGVVTSVLALMTDILRVIADAVRKVRSRLNEDLSALLIPFLEVDIGPCARDLEWHLR